MLIKQGLTFDGCPVRLSSFIRQTKGNKGTMIYKIEFKNKPDDSRWIDFFESSNKDTMLDAFNSMIEG